MDVHESSKSKFAAVGEMTENVFMLMEELYQSGFDTVHDSTLNGMEKAARQTEQYGMKYLSDLLQALADEIAASRHQMKKETAKMAQLYTKINEYIYLCRQKAIYDYFHDLFRF